jgi:apolipoprotein N-acyltransferase
VTGDAPAAVRRAQLAIALVAGAIGVAGFAPAGISPLAIVSVAILFGLAALRTPRGAFALGFAWGLGHFGAGVSWVYVSLHDFGMMPAPIAALATAIFCAYLALFPAAAVGAMQRIGGSAAARLLVAAPGLWVLAEWVRMWLFTGFPWLALGYSQIDTPLSGLAPLGGVFAVSLASAFVAGALASLFLTSGAARAAALGVAGALFAAGFAAGRIEWTSPAGNRVSVALLQGNISQDLKFDPARYRATLETYVRLAETSRAKLIVFPETAVPRFLDAVDPAFVERIAAHARANAGDVLLGAPMRDADGRYFNALVSLGSSPRQTYAKSHLVPFGEFIPPGFHWIVAVLRIPLSDFSRGGREQQPLAVAGERVAPNICYEDVFGEEIIRMLPAATLLANVSNVAWFGDSLAPAQHLEISRMRALESGRYLLRATNTGVTAIVDDRGRVVARLPTFTEGVLEGTAQGRTGATPYVRAGNAPSILFSLALVVAAGVMARRVNRAPTL